MLNMLIPVLCFLLPGTLPAVTGDPGAVPVQGQPKRPIEVLMGSLTKYHIGVFRATAKWTDHSEQAIADHMSKNRDRIKDLVLSGKLVGMVAASGKSDLRMVIFFRSENDEEIRDVVDKSYAVRQGLVTGETFAVWGTRGLGEGFGKMVPEGGKQQQKHFLVVLTKGKTWKDNPDQKMVGLVDVHASNVLKLRESGMLRFYGAVDGSGVVRNISIVTGTSAKDVQSKLATGELIASGWFSAAVVPCIVAEGTLP